MLPSVGLQDGYLVKAVKNNKCIPDTLLDTGDRAVKSKFIVSFTFSYLVEREWQTIEQVRIYTFKFESPVFRLFYSLLLVAFIYIPQGSSLHFPILFPGLLLRCLTLLKSSILPVP